MREERELFRDRPLYRPPEDRAEDDQARPPPGERDDRRGDLRLSLELLSRERYRRWVPLGEVVTLLPWGLNQYRALPLESILGDRLLRRELLLPDLEGERLVRGV